MSHDEDVPSVQDDPTSHHSRDTYHFSIYALLVMNHNLIMATITGAFLDRGANGGLIGADAKAFHIYRGLVDDTGIASWIANMRRSWQGIKPSWLGHSNLATMHPTRKGREWWLDD